MRETPEDIERLQALLDTSIPKDGEPKEMEYEQ